MPALLTWVYGALCSLPPLYSLTKPSSQSLMRELATCSSKLDNARTKGQTLLVDPTSTNTNPKLSGQVKGQLTQLEEGLEALDQTARKIQARLQVAVQQQQKYLDTLQSCHDWLLQAWGKMPAMSLGSKVKTNSLEDAERQVEVLKVISCHGCLSYTCQQNIVKFKHIL